jgi:predicted nucleic acid-binding protein
MAGFVFDTCIWIARKPSELPNNLLMSAIVVLEMTSGSADSTNVKRWRATYLAYERENRLLVPTSNDWYEAGKILNSLRRWLTPGVRARDHKLTSEERQRIMRDVLIARTAKSVGATVITDNVKDFALIQSACKVKVMSGDEYFGKR